MESLILLSVFGNTPFTFGSHGISGLHYEALKDQLKWIGLKPKKYVNIMQTCFNYYMKGVNSKG